MVFGIGLFGILFFNITQANALSLGVSTNLEIGAYEAMPGCDTTVLGTGLGCGIQESIVGVSKTVEEKVIIPIWKLALVQGLLDVSQFVVNRLAYESAVMVATGGPGQDSLFYGKSAVDGWSDFGLEIAGKAVEELNDGANEALGTKFDICAPSGSIFTLGLAIGLQQQYQPNKKPRCDINEVINNWGSFTSEVYSTISDPDKASQAILSKFAESLRPGRNELSASIKLNNEISRAVGEKKQLEANARFTRDFKPVKDPVTGKITTPPGAIEQDFLSKLIQGNSTQLDAKTLIQASDSWGSAAGGLATIAASTFTNTLLSKLLNKVYTGLFEPSSEKIDPFNVEALAQNDQSSEKERLASLFVALPFAQTSYNALTEFVVCPPQGVANRGINNCVMDSKFLSAVSRGQSGIALTVQEAINEGLIDGNWSLYSSEDRVKNQDPFCYDHAFCYANLVKLRKARVIPIGWELAALANKGSSPKTLQTIINEFNNCNQFGSIDSTHPFCHLIDPNWVLKYPETQCRAVVNGEIRLTQLSPGRQSLCADTPSCLGEDGNGKCTEGFGYCVEEKNVWRFRGDACSEKYAGCFAFTGTTSNQKGSYLINTVDFSVCGQDNAGCQWYRTNKTLDAKGDGQWLLPNEAYVTKDREADSQYQTSAGAISTRKIYGTSPARYSYEDRLYVTRSAKSCSASDGGCAEMIPVDGATLNMVSNPSFEQDENKDDLPDDWLLEGFTKTEVNMNSSLSAARGKNSLSLSTGVNKKLTQYFYALPNQFYTVSYFATQDANTGNYASVNITLLDDEITALSSAGFSLSSGCTLTPTNEIVTTGKLTTHDWERFSCTFTTPALTKQIQLSVSPGTGSMRYDAIQLEPALQSGTNFVEGLEGGQNAKFVKVAPDYLGCKGSVTDSGACESYAQMCSPQDVGCDLYTPKNGNPPIPAIAGALDSCPAECTGYEAYKQEATPSGFDIAHFPVYFIPTKATACSEQYVGCDSFTNLASSTEGGESIAHYTNLRACLTTQMTSAVDPSKQSATFFTWEGEDNAGYQLRSWVLLESSGGDSDTIGSEKNVGKAPCTKWDVSSKTELVCEDEVGTHLTSVVNDPTCNAHEDIFTNNDCREFFDTAGNVHYRLFSDTVTVSDQCLPYRKDQSIESDCQGSGGYWDKDVGFCRYFGLAAESLSCPATQNGCRAYTGGTGQNSAKLFTENFEDGSYEGFVPFGSLAADKPLLMSNESIATGGHSLRVVSGSGEGGFATTRVFLNNADDTITFIPDSGTTTTSKTTCTNFDTASVGHKVTSAGCEIDLGKNGSVDCVISKDQSSCGTLVNKLVKGKTFTLEFWAKGSGTLTAAFEGVGTIGNPVALTGGWQVHHLGPFDTSGTAFNKNTRLLFTTTQNASFYIDNIVLTQAEENVTVIKNSWVVPATCDSTPNGVSSPQYYLGCQDFTNKKGDTKNLYQFSNLCSEKVVGCSAFYQTFQSKSTYAQVSNARCATAANGDLEVTKTKPAYLVSQNTACTVNGVEYCTITTGRSYCTFDYDGTFGNLLPLDKTPANPPAVGVGFGIVYGPEAVMTPGDRPVYIVDDGKADCSSTVAGCQEVGKPKFSQDLKKVESFESAYILNTPAEYETLLCDNEALFCEEFASTKNGNYYFKNPLKKTCEYKTDVQINKKKFEGWFRTGTSDPCYPTYITGGDHASIWQNGDKNYDGWVASCPNDQNLCTEFEDVVDAKSYYFLNNDKLSSQSVSETNTCNGQVSQKEGCALFNNTSSSDLKYNASATYLLSTHADVLLKRSPNVLVDPVSCTVVGGGEYTVSEDDKAKLGLSSTDVKLCNSRCSYVLDAGDVIVTNMSELVETTSTYSSYRERSCLTVQDCPTLTTKNGKPAVSNGCFVSNHKLSNDSNLVQKVARDRSCSGWLACDSYRTSWNEQNNKYEQICDSVDLCVEGGSVGQESLCTDYEPRSAQILTSADYSKRDVTWNGTELSGYSIPNQLPVELYDQFNVNPEKVCMNGDKPFATGAVIPCETNDECAEQFGDGVECKQAPKDFRLVYNAGPCDSEKLARGVSCQIGTCLDDKGADTGVACSSSDDCAGEMCAIGSCQQTASPGTSGCLNNDCSCTQKSDCPGTFICDAVKNVCVDQALGPQKCGSGSAPANGCTLAQACVPSATTATGSCFNNRCLTNIVDVEPQNGFADPLKMATAQGESCRGYPEVDSPYPTKIVKEWTTARGTKTAPQTGFDTSPTPSQSWSVPYTFASGYQDSKTCAVDENGVLTQCDCSYDKVEYGKGVFTRYQSESTQKEDLPDGFCSGGPYEGHICTSDETCSKPAEEGKTGSDVGTCLRLTQKETMIGWQGYCIERDSAIQLYGSTNETKDQACLTWLPVDQLTGATDLYAKFTSAGFEPQQALYCAEIGLAYDIGMTGVYCSETQSEECQDGNGGDNTFVTPEDFSTDGIGSDMYCPTGYFAVFAGCGDAAPAKDDDEDNYWCGGADDDWPYFCVPKFSFHTKDATGKPTDKGEPCEIPTESSFVKSKTENWFVGKFNNVDTYLLRDVTGPSWTGIRTGLGSYEDCQVKGIFKDSTSYQNFVVGGELPSTIAYPACKSLVEVATASKSDSNAAWTNRVWQSGSYHVASEKGIGIGGVACAETGGWTQCGGVDNDNPYSDVNCAANQFAILGPCEALGMCEHTFEDNDYPYFCVPKGSFKIAPDGSKKDCVVPKVGDFKASSSGTGPTASHNGTDIYYMNSGKWSEAHTAYSGCYTQIPGYSVKTTPPIFGSALPLDSKITNVSDPSPHRLLTCQEGNSFTQVQVDTEGSKNICSTPTLAGLDEAKGYYRTKLDFNSGLVYPFSDEVSFQTLGNESKETAAKKIQSLFAKSYRLLTFNKTAWYPNAITNTYKETMGTYDKNIHELDLLFKPTAVTGSWKWDDVRKTGDDMDQPTPPTVVSLGQCLGTKCKEGSDDAFSVNDQDGGDIEGVGAKHVSVSFFTYANSNQMPIRNIITDWGDSDEFSPTMPWPTDSQTGSNAPDNYYKNHRGLNAGGGEICGSDPMDFGLSPEACSNNYVVFTHDYVCSTATVNSWKEDGARICKVGDDGRLLNSPCTGGEVKEAIGKCVYQPRVHVKDNWGWCTGFCNAGDDNPEGIGTNGCFGGTGEAENKNRECNISACPSEGNSKCADSEVTNSIVNPWVNYNGYILIEPAE